MAGETITQAQFNVCIKDFDNKELEIVVHHAYMLYAKDENDYGNRTGVKCVLDGGMPEYYDTRYDLSLNADGSNFVDWCKDEIAARWRDRLVTIVDVK